MGGIGKTVLAAAVAQDPEVGATFPDGVLWVAVGQRPRLLEIQQDLATLTGSPEAVFRTPEQGKLLLKRQLAGSAVLLILDDVWELRHASVLDVVGSRGRLVLTSRNREILVGLEAEEVTIEVLAPEQARTLLTGWADPIHPSGRGPSRRRWRGDQRPRPDRRRTPAGTTSSASPSEVTR